jgi:HSP20 family protein
MTLVKFNQPMSRSLNNFFDLWNEMPNVLGKTFTPETTGQAPVNITETNETYKLEFSLPGRKKEEFNVSIDKNLLTVSYEKKQEQEEENEKRIRKEFSFESFKRTFTLDERIEAEKISAKYENGILTLELPKKEEVKNNPKQIEIQ